MEPLFSRVLYGGDYSRTAATAQSQQVFTLRDGKICRYREYTDTAAWDTGYRST